MASRLVVKAMFHPFLQNRFLNDPFFFQQIKEGRELAFVEVSVTSVYGVPKKGLEISDFTVSLMAAPEAQVLGVDLLMMVKEDLPGFYALFLSRAGSPKWAEGEYVVAIAVHSKTTTSVAQGQTLVGFKFVN